MRLGVFLVHFFGVVTFFSCHSPFCVQEVKQRDHVILCFYLPDTFFIRTCLRGMWHPRSIHTTSRQTVKKSHSGKHLWYRGSCSSQRVVGIWRNCMVSLHIILHIPIPKKLFLSLFKLPDLRLKTALYTTFPYES